MSSFDDSQRSYMLSELNRAIPVGSRAADMSTIQAALGTVDSAMPAETRQVSNALRMFSTFGGASNEALQRDAACRSIPSPSTSMRPDAGARAGCGWWYVPDPSTPSVGAYGTRRGPMNPNLGTQIGAGQWIWDPAQAMQMEGTKAAAQIKACPDIQYAQSRWPTMGWCTQTNMAILTDGQGNPMYPRTAGGDCAQGSIIMSASACPAPSAPAQPAAPASSISGACGSGTAPLTPACLQNLATYTCSGNGALAQAYSSGGWPSQNDQIALTNQVLMQRGFTLPTGVMQDGQIAVQDALSAFSALKAATVDPSMDARGQGAAANLCLGSPFDPCNFQPTDTGPFPPQCIAQTALGMGYAQNAGLMPSNVGMNYWNTQLGGNTWSDVVSNLMYWKQTADTPQPQQPSLQAQAVSNVYGVNMKFPVQGCNVNGAMVYRYYFPPGAMQYMPQYGGGGNQNPTTHFLGRYLLTQGLDQGVPNDMTEMTPGNDQLTEIKRMLFTWTPAQGGIYRFLTTADDYLYIYFNGQLFAMNAGNTSGQLTQPTDDIDPGVSINVQIDAVNVGGPWNYQFTPQTSADGGNTFQTAPLTLSQMNLPYDRRLPMLEWAFHRMQPTNYGASQLAAGVPIQDTNGALTQMSITGNIGQLNGRQCLVVGGPGQGLVNYGQQTLQGIRLMAMKSFTMMVCVSSVQINPANNITPTLVSFYNLPTSRQRGSPNPGAWSPQFAQTYYNRTNSFDIMAAQSSIYPYGTGPLQGTSTPAKTYFLDAISSGNSVLPLSQNQWFHLAWVWDANGAGYTIYLNGKQVGRGFMAPYDPQLITEMIRIGCDQTADGNSWTGGIQWFRAFDYRLSQAQINTDMQDNWANGLN